MNFFVTGLCLQGNKGGPAIALALKEQICRYDPWATFTFAVPGAEAFPYEQRWARRYGVSVVEELNTADFHPLQWLHRPMRQAGNWHRWAAALLDADCMLEMSGVSYVGPPLGRTGGVVLGRFRRFLMARLLRRPMVAWTQSYGPFSTATICAMARLDLSRQPIVLCRGEDCCRTVAGLLPDKQLRSFPDVAITLPYDRDRGAMLLRQEIGVRPEARLVTISPSAVIHKQTMQAGGRSAHERQVERLIEALIEREYQVILVPHTKRPQRPDPLVDDFTLARRIAERIEDRAVSLVRSDLSPIDLKSMISHAAVHVGGRYHSIVAALSTATPALAMSWHEKYRDLMRVFGLDRYVIDSTQQNPDAIVAMIAELESHARSHQSTMKAAQRDCEQKIDENVTVVLDMAREFKR